MKTSLTIAGSDSIGGAGIQADLKTMTALGVYGMSVITAVTAQNTLGVASVYNMATNAITAQLDAVFTDIFPDSVKIGMLSTSEIICTVADELEKYKAKNIVLDPVMVSTSGHSLLDSDAQSTLISRLFPIAHIITPNIPEAQSLLGYEIKKAADMEKAANELCEKYNVSVLLKGGHLTGSDLLRTPASQQWFRGNIINNPNTHGTGCTLSSAIASYLAKGYSMEDSVRAAKEYITGAISAMLDLGKGRGPINHMWQK